jgi:hypothetical protein
MQFFKPENYFEVRKALVEAKRTDLIGNGCDCLIPAQPPKAALDRRRDEANKNFRGDYVHTIPAGERRKRTRKESRHQPGPGYRPDTKKSR